MWDCGFIRVNGDPETFARFETELADTDIDIVEITYDSETDRISVWDVSHHAGNEDRLLMRFRHL